MKQDRFLIAILIGIALLVALAIGLFFLRQGSLEYLAEDTPEGVLHNYILAIQLEDYQRAYSYLSDTEGKPDFANFRQEMVAKQSYDISGSVVKIGQKDQLENTVYISITILHNSNDPFSNRWQEESSASLIEQNGAWKLSSMPYPYWGWDWYENAPPEPVKVNP